MKVISFSLWGQSPKYLVGALENAAMAPRVYPGWRCRFHCGASVPRDVVEQLRAFPHVEIVPHDEPGDWTAMLWRMHDAANGFERLIVRDADSRLNERELAAVDAWIASRRDAHIMRDHPLHNRPILGGMWGVIGGVLPDMAALIGASRKYDDIQVDQDFLEEFVWPRLRHHSIHHDEYFGGIPFPTSRVGRSFVGQPFDEFNRPIIEGPTAFERSSRQTLRRIAQFAGIVGPPVRFSP